MRIPLDITFRDMEPTDSVESIVRGRIDKLDEYFRDIMRCEVVIEAPHQHHNTGKLYHVRVHITVPAHTLVASNEANLNHAHEDVYVAIRDAFDAMQRQLESHKARQSGETKAHLQTPQGQIVQLFPAMDYGLIDTIDGREIYFHRNSVKNASFDDLTEGNTVEFVEEAGEEGPQASAVRLIR